MPHPVRRHLSLSLTSSLDVADELAALLARSRSLSPRLRSLRVRLSRQLRAVEWTKADQHADRGKKNRALSTAI